MTELWVAVGLILMIQSTDIIDWLCDKIADSFNKEKSDDREVE
tara:strand:+ start:1833 stop:1961 length:129 start_codon:yes stop_codon:yes gene_type:complete